MTRREFAAIALAAAARAQTVPLKIAHREASMRRVGNIEVFALASRIPGLLGVELQTVAGNHSLWDRDIQRRYKREANHWGMQIPSLAAPFGRGTSIRDVTPAAEHLGRSIATAEFLGASVILVPFFRENCPSMQDESEYGPVVEMLRKVAPRAADSGVTLSLENSLNPADNVKLCDLVAHPAVRIYYDLDNCEFYKHTNQSTPGVAVMGKDRIRQVHVKNEERLIEEPGRVNWRAALTELKKIGYDGWYCFESRHTSDEQCVSATTKNIAFLRSILA
jgi:sugar phosphate isomerase/epimerase